MTLSNKIAWDDNILPFQLDTPDIRGRVARLDGVLDQILSQHNYPLAVEQLVAEAAVLTALIGQTIDLRWKLSLQIRGDGPVKMIATDYFAPVKGQSTARLRAYANFDATKPTDGPVFDLLGQGVFGILIDQGSGTKPYQGITPLAGGSIANSAATYFAQSEQLPTRFALALGKSQEPGDAARWRAGGIMVQHMPKASPHANETSGEEPLLTAADLVDGTDEENWNRVNFHLDTIEEFEMIGPHVAPGDLLHRLFHAETPRVFDSQPIRFGCTCSAEKVEDALSIYPAAEIAEMTTAEGKVTADCQFCGKHYEFVPEHLGLDAQSDDG